MHLSAFMDARKLTDAEVATAVGRNRASISRYRRRVEMPSWEVIERIFEFSGGLVEPNDWLPASTTPAEPQHEAAE